VEVYSQEVLGFSDTTTSGNLTPYDDLIVSTTFPTLTSFGDSDFLLFEEADAFLGLEDDLNSPKINPFYYDPEGDILLLEAILNSKPLPPLPKHEQDLPSFKKELKLPKIGDPDKFLIPCEFPRMDECLALANLGASINLMPLFVWEGLSLLEHTPTCMTLKLTDRSVSKPIGIAKDVSFKVGVFHFPAD
nr:reverse transcriptase domain-containing protein [Tanacetum cinerariifolium]